MCPEALLIQVISCQRSELLVSSGLKPNTSPFQLFYAHNALYYRLSRCCTRCWEKCEKMLILKQYLTSLMHTWNRGEWWHCRERRKLDKQETSTARVATQGRESMTTKRTCCLIAMKTEGLNKRATCFCCPILASDHFFWYVILWLPCCRSSPAQTANTVQHRSSFTKLNMSIRLNPKCTFQNHTLEILHRCRHQTFTSPPIVHKSGGGTKHIFKDSTSEKRHV